MRDASSSDVFTSLVARGFVLTASSAALADLFRLVVVVMSVEVAAAGVSPLTFVPLDMILVLGQSRLWKDGGRIKGFPARLSISVAFVLKANQTL